MIHNRLLAVMLILVSASLFSAGCDKGNIRKDKDLQISVKLTPENKEKVRKLLQSVSELNASAPESISTKFLVQGKIKKKKFKSLGEATFDSKKDMMYISFMDFIFKSPIAFIFKKDEEIKFYFPVDKKVFVDNTRSIKLKHYSDFDVDFDIIYDALRGRIPIIENYKIKELVLEKKRKGTYLVLENKKMYQTISFSSSRPDKMLVINKKTRERFEIYFKRYMKSGESTYFRHVRVTAKDGALNVDVHFKNTRLNLPVQVKTLDDFRLRRNTKIIPMASD